MSKREINTKIATAILTLGFACSCHDSGPSPNLGTERDNRDLEVVVLDNGAGFIDVTWTPTLEEAERAVDSAYQRGATDKSLPKKRSDYGCQVLGVGTERNMLHLNFLDLPELFGLDEDQVLGVPEWRNHYLYGSNETVNAWRTEVRREGSGTDSGSE